MIFRHIFRDTHQQLVPSCQIDLPCSTNNNCKQDRRYLNSVKKVIVLHRKNPILGIEELMYIIYLIMINNVQQVLLKTFLGAIIVAHGPVEMSFGCFCCKQNRDIFIFSINILGKIVLSP